MDQDFNVADSTDWLNTSLSTFAPLESALRCQVCKDFYNTPMITSCSHTFCSLCIRTCLSSDGKCPTCRTNDQASKLRRNWTVQEVVDAFQAARPAALEFARTSREHGKVRETRSTRLKRKLEDTDLEGEEEGDSGRRRTRITRSQSRRGAAGALAAPPELIALDDDQDGDCGPEDDGLVPCPICNTRMKEEAVYSHLDQCGGEKKQGMSKDIRTGSSTSAQTAPQRVPPRQPSQEPSRLPQLNYSLLKDTQLRKKLQELGIPAWGSKQLLIRRHTEWVNLFNANCDSVRPRTKRELLRDLDVWERSQGGNSSNANGTSVGSHAIMCKDFDGQGWAESNRDQFAQLIARARRKEVQPTNIDRKDEEDAQSSIPRSVSTIPNAPTQDVAAAGSDTAPEDNETPSSIRPYENNEEALSTIRSKVQEADQDYPMRTVQNGDTVPADTMRRTSSATKSHHPPLDRKNSGTMSVMSQDLSRGSFSRSSQSRTPPNVPSSLHTHLHSSPSKKLPMFAVPEYPVSDMDGETTVQ